MNLQRQLRNGWLTVLKYTLNPLTRRLARSSFGPFSIVRHIGRRSGKRERGNLAEVVPFVTGRCH